jgi:LDH2 family malate/lactate/ureidoglycolate dehydrogenase
MSDAVIPLQDLRTTVADIFEGVGMDAQSAATMADALSFADLRGIYSHGVSKVPEYLPWLTGGVNPQAVPFVRARRGATAIVDADNGMGHIACAFAMREAVAIAADLGVGVVSVANSNHCGVLAYFTQIAVDAGMIGLAMTNTLPTIAPWGGLDRIVGNSPLSVGFPSGSEQAVLLDTSFGVVARGKIVVHYKNGIPLPEGWAFDKHGKPTTDPAAAMVGLNAPIAGPKGVGLGITFGMLSALLSGASYGSRMGSLEDGPQPGHDGQVVIAIDPAAFGDRSMIEAAADDIVREIHESRKAEGVERLFVPGEPETINMRRYEAEGVPVNGATVDAVREWATKLGVTSAWL